MLFRNAKGKVVGELAGDIYRKKVEGSKHLLKMMDAWGIDKSIVVELVSLGAQEIRILDTETDIVYSIPVTTFVDKSVVRDFGDTEQMFLSRHFFTKEELVPSGTDVVKLPRSVQT